MLYQIIKYRCSEKQWFCSITPNVWEKYILRPIFGKFKDIFTQRYLSKFFAWPRFCSFQTEFLWPMTIEQRVLESWKCTEGPKGALLALFVGSRDKGPWKLSLFSVQTCSNRPFMFLVTITP